MTSISSTNNGTQSKGNYLHLTFDENKVLGIKPFSIPLSDDAPSPLLTTRNATAKTQCDEKKAGSSLDPIDEEIDSDLSDEETDVETTWPESVKLIKYKTREELTALLAKDGTVKLQSYTLATQIEMSAVLLITTNNSIKPIIQEFSHPERSLYNYLTGEFHSKWIDDPLFVSKDTANRARIARVAIQATVAKKIKEFAANLA